MIRLDRRIFLASTAAAAVTFSLPAFAQSVEGLMNNIPLEDKVMGQADAPVTIVEYASMTCPHCKTFHDTILPDLKKDYIETGKAKYILRPFPFDGDRRGEAAFMLALCAPNDNYYAMVDALFATQKNWGGQGNPVPELLRISKLAGMSEADFKACLGNQDLLTKMVQGRNKAVKEFGVRATPTVFINGEKVGEPSLANLKEAIEAAS
ncbi:DsbA family protein [Ahrensia sp. R2A130]|uniref:DsbA family protein n=1 Tax=Ahrensia sp. R2A130 TaxID=744979 RepID=UPI0001E0D878|nr:DsbA family protein [Ahrensia sp. R2A130]EFL88904.1 twin-arginine translocation pathway signal sequence domain-containing protein [Ahrensia sp. R2A130]